MPGNRWIGILAATLAVSGCGRSADPAALNSPPPSSAQHTPPRSSPQQTPSAARSIASPPPLIAGAQWTTTDKGRQLRVFPTTAGRTTSDDSGSARAWAEVVRDAPDAATPGMHDQFLCHWNFARIAEPDKPSWNLEPWRPVVGYQATVAALCNPGGSES